MISHPFDAAKARSTFKARVLSLATALLVLAVGPSIGHAESVGSLQDGPYITRSAEGWTARWIENRSQAPLVLDRAVKVGDVVNVAAIGAFPAFEVALRGPARNAPDEIKVSASA